MTDTPSMQLKCGLPKAPTYRITLASWLISLADRVAGGRIAFEIVEHDDEEPLGI